VRERAEAWTERLKRGATRVARDLYAGEHWSIIKSLAATGKSSQRPIEVWICSAGYGLINWDTLIVSYSATFSGGEPDSVVAGTEASAGAERAAWWAALARWRGPGPGGPRTITELVEEQPRTPLLVAASPWYVQAMASDLAAARQRMNTAASLMLVSGGLRRCPDGLDGALLPCDARLSAVLGGSRASLNARLAKMILDADKTGFTLEAWEARLSRLLARQAPLECLRGRHATDPEVRAFIEKARRSPATTPSRTRLLGLLRDSGYACEQVRFRRLYEDLVGKD
jgi:hypothetical protein